MSRARLILATVATLLASAVPAHAATATSSVSSVRHVFIIVLENESASTTFGSGSPAPYLSQTLRPAGAYLPNYYAVGHESNDNYIAMISGQAPGVQSQADCQDFDDMTPGTIGSYGQAQGSGCVYPASVQTIASQLTAAGFTWRDYNEDMGADPSRETAVCAHPAVGSSDNTQKAEASDQYAARHNPFVYFHSIIDDTTLCDTHVVNLDELPQDLTSAGATANYSFITPDLCDDGHDAPCANGQPGGLTSADAFLKTWVPQITASPAFRQDGLLIVTFDEAATSDTSDCCGEIPGPNSPEPGATGPGGGDVGAVLLSPCIAPGTVSETPYNHYTMLGSVENIFGLSHLGYAQLPGETYFGADIFNRPCAGGPPMASIRAPGVAATASTGPRVTLRWGATAQPGGPLASYTVVARDLGVAKSPLRTLAAATQATSLPFSGARGHTYAVSVTATDVAGQSGAAATATVVFPSGIRPAKGHYSRHWKVVRRRGAWGGRAIQSTTPGATFRLRYVGGSLALVGERTRRGGVLRVTVDGRSRTLHLHAARLHRRRVLTTVRLPTGVHHLTLRVIRGLVAIEGYGVTARSG